jgi:CRP/FNR family cyclic AMP-dependent transcriptional regulator
MSTTNTTVLHTNTYSGTSEGLEEFFKTFPVKHYDKGQIFAFPGEFFDRIRYILAGTVRVYDISQGGNEIVVNVFKPGALFPMSKALNKTYNHYFYQADGPLKTREAPISTFEDFLMSHPDAMLSLLAESHLTAQVMRRRMAHLMGGSATNRLIFELLVQAEGYGDRCPDGSYFIPISEGEIGARSGLSRETVSREIRKFKASDLISISNRGIVLRSANKLESMMGSLL